MVSLDLLLFLINDILDYEQIKNGKVRITIEPFSLSNLIEEVKHLVEYQMKTKNLEFKINTERVRNDLIKSDKNRVKQVLINFLTNAIKFTT